MIDLDRAGAMDVLRLEAGARIFSEGEPGDHAYLIGSGSVEIVAGRDGPPVVLARLGAGELIGEMAVIDDHPRSATARALEPVELLVITRDVLRGYLEKADPLLSRLLHVLIARMRHAQRALVQHTGGAPSAPDPTQELPGDGEGDVFSLLIDDLKIRQALAEGALEPFFQPIVELGSGRLAGFETLVRWRHPERGLVMPADFIPTAERSGLIRAVDLHVFERAARAVLAAGSDGGRAPFLSINLSGSHFASLEVIDQLAAIIEDTGFPPSRLKVEITEGVLVAHPERALAVIEAIHGLGAQVSLDDFGTGYSSLSYLHRFPIDVLKIDRSFVVGMAEHPRTAAITTAMLQLAGALGLQVVAEGIEDDGIVPRLCDLGCHYGQGWLFGRPMPADAMRRLVASGRTAG
ncbi:EAL domain-containing protein [Azospirillum canadense]|uniref:EAL domain-containing protein n=1 Tax=Azospirillum canadense TaxID=403962 RepID=UPI00222675D9|nr:EAL domain-containing protein [Azospirillum canadense]MCW2240210.1 EAL domain-containing protein (putative c-di-GMP-specific phosphodiesterase class I) [Azospirillum canadense]